LHSSFAVNFFGQRVKVPYTPYIATEPDWDKTSASVTNKKLAEKKLPAKLQCKGQYDKNLTLVLM